MFVAAKRNIPIAVTDGAGIAAVNITAVGYFVHNNDTMAQQIEPTPEVLANFSANLRKIHLFGIAIEYAGANILDYLPSTTTKEKCKVLMHAPENFLKSLKNKLGEATFSKLMEVADENYEQLGEKWSAIHSILLMSTDEFTDLKERMKDMIPEL